MCHGACLGRSEGDDVVGIYSLILAIVALGVGEGPRATDNVAVRALSSAAHVVDGAGCCNCSLGSLGCLANEHIVERQSNLLAVLRIVVQVENTSHIVVTLDELLLASDDDAGSSDIHLSKWIGSDKLVLLT